tara:strand:+ start:633 stop:1121 length:489 start_codon:yes stop_codon:yes gene_type:complete
MKRLLLPFWLFSTTPCLADLTHSITSSAQLQVNAGITQSERIGSSYSVSGTGVDVAIGDDAGRISNGTITSGVYSPGTVLATQNATSGESFSFSQAYTQADAIPGAAVTTGAAANFSDVTSHAAGVASSLAGGVTSAGVVSLVAGGQGTVATGSVVSSVTIK